MGQGGGEWEEIPKFLSGSRKAPELEKLWGLSIGERGVSMDYGMN